jgi:hypothetical protein
VKRIAAFAAVVALSPLALWVLFTLWLNFGLPLLINGQPERVRVRYDAAWMVVPGRLEIRGLEIRNQGLRDQWQLEVARASTEIDLPALLTRTFVAEGLRAEGARLHYRRRLEEGAVASPYQAPVPGFDNPPSRPPEAIYGHGKKWKVVVRDGEIRGIDGLWIGDVRYVGPAVARGSCALGGPIVSADATLAMQHGALGWGTEVPVAEGIIGTVSFRLEELEKSVGLQKSTLDLVTAEAAFDAQVQGFDFLDFYLAQATWLRLDGTGHLAASARLRAGRLEDGSFFRAETRDLDVAFLGYAIHGDAVVSGRVGPLDGRSQSQVTIQYGRFHVAEPEGEPLLAGEGFRVGATSDDVRLHEPFTRFDVRVDVPESTIPEFSLFGSYLPKGVGFALTGGAGRAHGTLRATVPGQLAQGDLWIEVDGARGDFDGLDLSGDLALHAHLEQGDLGARSYDFSGSELKMRNVRLRDEELLVGDHPWSATLRARSGKAVVGAPVWLTADLSLKVTDTLPFVVIAARKKSLAPWVRGLLTVRDVEGTAALWLGDDLVRIAGLDFTGRQFEVKLGWERKGRTDNASLFTRFGAFSFGVGIDGPERTIQVLGAREWYDGRVAGVAAGEAPPPERKKREKVKKSRE